PGAPPGSARTDACAASLARASAFLFERVLDLLADVLVVLGQQLFFVLGQDSEWHADETLLELHVQPVLAVRDPTWHLEVDPTETCALGAELDLVVGHCTLVQLGEEPDSTRLARARRKVVDRVPLDLRAGLQRAEVRRAHVRGRGKGNRLAVRCLERERVAGHGVVRHAIANRRSEVEEHPLVTDRLVGDLIAEDDVALVVVGGAYVGSLQRHDLRHAGFGYLHGWLLLRRLVARGRQRRHRDQRSEGEGYQARGSHIRPPRVTGLIPGTIVG